MRKIFILLICLGMLLSAQNCVAGPIGFVNILFDETSVSGGQSTATSIVIPVKSSGYFGCWYKVTAPLGSPDLKIQCEMSYDDTADHFVVPTNMRDIVSSEVEESTKVTSINPPPMKYMRIKVSGNTANTTGTTITMYLFRQE